MPFNVVLALSDLPGIFIPIAYLGLATVVGTVIWQAAVNVSTLRSMKNDMVTKLDLQKELSKLKDGFVTRQELPWRVEECLRDRRSDRRQRERKEHEG